MILILTLFTIFAYSKSVGVKCSQVIGNSIFNFDGLQTNIDYTFPYSGAGIGDGTLYIRFCDYVSMKCDADTYGSFKTSQNKCYSLTGSNPFSDYSYDLIDGDENKGVYMTLQGGDINPITNKSFSVKYTIQCNKNAKKPDVSFQQLSGNQFEFLVSAQEGCPVVNLSLIWNFVEEHKIPFIIGGIVGGLFLCFFGLKLMKITLFLAGFGSGAIIVMIFFAEFIIKSGDQNWEVYVAFTVAGIAGIILGVITVCFYKIGVVAMGIWLGVILSFVLFNSFFYKIQTSPDELILYILIIVLSIAIGVIAFKLVDHVMIIASSICGGYAFVRGISLFAGNFPNELTITKMIRYGNFDFPWQFYIYLVAILILSIFGMVFQYKQYHKTKKGNSNDQYYHALHQV